MPHRRRHPEARLNRGVLAAVLSVAAAMITLVALTITPTTAAAAPPVRLAATGSATTPPPGGGCTPDTCGGGCQGQICATTTMITEPGGPAPTPTDGGGGGTGAGPVPTGTPTVVGGPGGVVVTVGPTPGGGICAGMPVAPGVTCRPGALPTATTAPTAPGTPGAPLAPPTRGEILQLILQMHLPTPTIGSAPCTDAGCMGAVGVPVWLWHQQLGPQSKVVSIRGYQITLNATAGPTTWSMGDGNTVVCNGPGTPYDISMGWATSPDCGYQYDTKGHFTIRAAITWHVTWGGVASGTQDVPLTSAVNVTIGEYQALVR